MVGPTIDEAVEWRVPIWSPAVSSALDRAAPLLAPVANILEVGYNTGMMSCYMAGYYGWNLVGYDISDSLRIKAENTAQLYGVEKMTDFRVCSPDATLSIKGDYDAVFLKSVLYHISDKMVYRSWLDWLHSVLRDGGVVIAIENGRGGLLDKIYRERIKKARWATFLLFDRWAEQEFRQRFRDVDARYFGRFSQFFTAFPKACSLIRSFEEKFCPPSAEHCFVSSIVAKK